MALKDRSRYGMKHACHVCETKFYDFNKPNPICPKCGADPNAAPEPEAPVVVVPKPDPFEALAKSVESGENQQTDDALIDDVELEEDVPAGVNLSELDEGAEADPADIDEDGDEQAEEPAKKK